MDNSIRKSLKRPLDQSLQSEKLACEKQKENLEEKRRKFEIFNKSASYSDLSSLSVNPEILNQAGESHRKLSRSVSDRALCLNSSIIEESMPKSSYESLEVKKVFEAIENINKETIEKKEDIDNRSRRFEVCFEKLIGSLSSKTLQEFKERDTGFVSKRDTEVFYLVVKKNANGKQVELPLPYKYESRGMVLRAFDQLLEIYQQREDSKVGEGETLLSSRTQMFDASNSPDPKIRAEIATRTFLANEMLGEHGFSIKGYRMAEMYHDGYENGIRLAFAKGDITKDTPISERMKIGHEYARDKYLESIQPKGDIPLIFPTMQPGSYFEESSIPELKGGAPAKVGSQEFDNFMKDLMVRKQKGDNFTITANILPSEEIMAQPFYITESSRSGHAQNTKGGHCVWSGEVDIDYDTKTILRIKDQSGHFRTTDKKDPGLMILYALKKFKDLSYNVLKAEIELTSVVGPKEVLYKNYQPLTDSGWKNESMKTIEQSWQKLEKEEGYHVPDNLREIFYEIGASKQVDE